MTHVVLRCDATLAGGIGHLVRAVSVADAAREAGHTVSVAGEIESPLAVQLLADAGLEVVDAPEDLEILAAEQGASVVHVDDYTIGTDARDRVRASGALLSSMEDGTFGRRPADVVVDSTIRAEKLGRPDDGSGTVLLGISYAPMRAQVRAAREERAANHEVGSEARVLIVMGGTDATGAAGTVAALCAAAEGIGKVTVISPEQNWDAVRAEAGDGIELLAPSPAFLDLACRADLVISAAGTTAWELACIGVPNLLVAVVENQRAGYEAALAEGISRGLGTLEEVRADPRAATETVAKAVADLRQGRTSVTVGQEKVDGHGADRIVAAWSEALSRRIGEDSAPVTARPATAEDSSLLLRWRNDPQTREVSRSTERVSWDSHTGWYRRVLEDPRRELYVVERDGTPVGTVRFDALEDTEWEVSITLAPESRGHGLSRPVLAAGEAAFDQRHPGALVVASVLPGNVPSQRLFARAGYVLDPEREDGDFDVLVRTQPR
ncbi:bifunctional UDP-2,4-diacetamido-2,4,6-trideoxy-beta-L-altropyranose hydrolase/GNAT family N-acetyltransferase [Brachybacterium aquaticum]|uniref:Spore coat polysaccharide biosynthesis predicted glycosyltransferase SpsG/L-amino acid N-acyltransferase YncA n=1 Tax=Brachybacterium aquaticum TaxID=1432564 RepID=A0A841A6W2_9MICO|nr:bifunctional UDP-2,4-diacetamido-2,4,6-trideoxy-beta-L-altropyranose hydrolase/GNAT family N-acetyltransferase [Brachybacterium aquaticum]MBB5830909.1 spore coat polysaccharide biosynthesis predicted glycosyltransferase SpsG/L-amino acid N-acyltransferase YncA [Brachybacterium aquaticum]